MTVSVAHWRLLASFHKEQGTSTYKQKNYNAGIIVNTGNAWLISLSGFQGFFLPRDAMRKRGLCCRPVSVCPSVRLSVTLVYCIHMAEDIVKLLSVRGSSIILVFDSHGRYPISREPFQRGRKIHRGWKILRFSTEIAYYLGKIGP